jgi:hypothetical protein
MRQKFEVRLPKRGLIPTTVGRDTPPEIKQAHSFDFGVCAVI